MGINKALNNKAIEVAQQLCATYNPYKSTATERTITGSDLTVYEAVTGELYTVEALDAEYVKTAKSDFIHGYSDRIVGYYDKWYRYNHADEGRAYDEGVKYAVSQSNCKEEMIIIPCLN